MQHSDEPGRIVLPWADSGLKNTIPVLSQISITPGAASYTDGFPPLTMTEKPPLGSGIPPDGKDFNGVMNAATAIARWLNSGTFFIYNSAFATAIGGYPKGAQVLGDDLVTIWQNTVENNTTNPNSGGSGWITASSPVVTPYGFVSTGLTYTPVKNRIMVLGMGSGGGGGGGLATLYSGAGGSSGEFNQFLLLAVTPGVALSITLGRGGLGGAVGLPGANGTATSISGLPAQTGVTGGVYTFLGGLGGAAGNVDGTCAGGDSVGGTFNQPGNNGGDGWGFVPGAGGGALGSGSQPKNIVYPGPDDYTNGNARGAGGAGGNINKAGRNGGNGYLIIIE